MDEREIIIGNLTTILMFVFSTIGGGAIINWLGGTSQAVILVGACVGLGYSVLNAYFPNHLSFLKNNEKDIETLANNIPYEEDFENDGGC